MASLSEMTPFVSSSIAVKISAVQAACARRFWEVTADSWVNALCGELADWFNRITSNAKVPVPEFDVACRFILMSDFNNWYARRFSAVLAGSRAARLPSLPYAGGAVRHGRVLMPLW